MNLSDERLIDDPAHPIEPRAYQVYLRALVHSQPGDQASCVLCIHMDARFGYTSHKLEFGGRISPKVPSSATWTCLGTEANPPFFAYRPRNYQAPASVSMRIVIRIRRGAEGWWSLCVRWSQDIRDIHRPGKPFTFPARRDISVLLFARVGF